MYLQLYLTRVLSDADIHLGQEVNKENIQELDGQSEAMLAYS